MGLPDKLDRMMHHVNRFQWPDELARLLGTIPDAELAGLAGVTYQTVARERRRRGIAESRPRQKVLWTDEMLEALGTDSDRSVAAQLGINHRSVFQKRRALGIPPFLPPPRHKRPVGRRWTDAEKELLERCSDRQVGRLLNISAATVRNARLKFGIPPHQPPHSEIAWTDSMLEDLGSMPDREFARRHRLALETIQRKRLELGIEPWSKHPAIAQTEDLPVILGLPNRVLIERYGISETTVHKLRKRYGVRSPDTRNWRWTPEALSRLGREPDAAIARDLGLTAGAVKAKRRQFQLRFREVALWSEEELQILLAHDDENAAGLLNRSLGAVRQKRKALRK